MSVESVKYGDICDKCAHAEYCDMATFGGHNPKITACSKFTERHQSNADRIRSTTDEELAELLRDTQCNTCAWQGNDCDYADECKAEKLEMLKQECDDNGT